MSITYAAVGELIYDDAAGVYYMAHDVDVIDIATGAVYEGFVVEANVEEGWVKEHIRDEDARLDFLNTKITFLPIEIRPKPEAKAWPLH